MDKIMQTCRSRDMSLLDEFKRVAADMTGVAAGDDPDVRRFSPSDLKPLRGAVPMGPPPGYVPPAGDPAAQGPKKDDDEGIAVLKPAAIRKRNKGRKGQGDGEGGPG
jgi:hypothetical protein